jgi:hypothetical protein
MEFDDVDDDSGEEIGEDEVWKAMQNSSGFDKRGLLDGDDVQFEDEDDLDIVYTDSEEEDLGSEAGSEAENQFEGLEGLEGEDDLEGDGWEDVNGESEDEMAAWGKNKDSENEDEDEFAAMDQSDNSDLEDAVEEPKETKKKAKNRKSRMMEVATKLGYKGSFFEGKGDFASAEDFEVLQNMDQEESDGEEEVVKTASKSLKRKKIGGDKANKKRK